MRQRHRRMRLEVGIVLALALGACSDGRWRSDFVQESPKTIRVVSASSAVVPAARFIVLILEAGRPEWFGLRLRRDDNWMRARVVLRLRNGDNWQECSFGGPCEGLYMEESSIPAGFMPFHLRGSVEWSRRWWSDSLSARLRIGPQDDGAGSGRYVGSDGSFLSFDLDDITVEDDAAAVAAICSWREIGNPWRLREWQKEIAAATVERPGAK